MKLHANASECIYLLWVETETPMNQLHSIDSVDDTRYIWLNAIETKTKNKSKKTASSATLNFL